MKIIEIENLSKKYDINHVQQYTSDSLKAVISNGVKHFLRKMCRIESSEKINPSLEEFWALKDVTLDIEEGDRIAFLGKNGAGKSTLLKILSRITEPTIGRIKMRGRISSLLEVGTGFHLDLTGRENILLNGSIMGMKYSEIKKKMDEIIAFADIEKFLDTPIKRYSSGMFMRLGFAIAAHLDSEILIVDEVLAVGDAQFQEKCLKKMSEKSSEGRTILFVSHHIESLLALCHKGVLLEKGVSHGMEPIEQCVSRYVKSCPSAGLEWCGNLGDDHIRIYQASLRDSKTNKGFFYQCENTFLDIDFEILKTQSDLMIGFSVLNSRNRLIARSRLCDHPEYSQVISSKGNHTFSFQITLDLFHPGEYSIKLECSLFNKKRIIEDEIILKFSVYSQNKQLRQEQGIEKEGISLGNKWVLK